MRFKKLTHQALLGTALTMLSACFNSSDNSAITLQGDGGELVIFASDIKGETVNLSIDNKFLSVLQDNQEVNQPLCAGDYVLTASTVDKSSRERINRVIGKASIHLSTAQTTYVQLSRSSKGWEIKTLDATKWNPEQYAAANGKLLRRIPSRWLVCTK